MRVIADSEAALVCGAGVPSPSIIAAGQTTSLGPPTPPTTDVAGQTFANPPGGPVSYNWIGAGLKGGSEFGGELLAAGLCGAAAADGGATLGSCGGALAGAYPSISDAVTAIATAIDAAAQAAGFLDKNGNPYYDNY